MIEFPLRPRHDLCSGWEFIRGKVGRRWLGGDPGTGEMVDLPHCWNLDNTYQYDRNSYTGFGGYRRQIHLPASPEGAVWHLCSEGFYGVGEIRLDGCRLTGFDGQYLGFDIALPDWTGSSDHTLGIRLDNRFHRNVLPGKRQPDFLLYGGLVGRMWLEQRPIIHLAADRVELVCSPAPNGSELLELRTTLDGLTFPEPGGRLTWSVTTADGSVVATFDPIPLFNNAMSTSTSITDPHCWSPENPHLYWAEGRLEDGSGVVDVIRVRFGITRAEFRSGDGFYLDGERIDLHGANRHESIPGLGSALPPELHRSDARLLKDYGCNFVRLSHYPQHPTFLDACDELGIMVYAEIASWKSVRSSRGWRRAARRQFHDLIIRDRHHPSVIIWGMGNESRSRKAFLELRQIACELDSSRPVTYAENHLYRARRQKTVGIPDVWGMNYELDVLDEARETSRLGIVLISECCNHPTSVKGDQSEELEQLVVIEREWELMADREGLAGHAAWSFTDYATEYRDRTRRQTGLFDAWRRPKMAAELYRARYSNEPFVALFLDEGHQDRSASRFRKDITGSSTDGGGEVLHVFSNCERILIDQAGSLLATLEGALHYTLPIKIDRGELSAVGHLGSKISSRTLRPHTEAVRVELTNPNGAHSGGETNAIDISIIDAAGELVRDWNGNVMVSADGGARLHSYTSNSEALITRGEGRIYATLLPGAERATITGRAHGLETGYLLLATKASG